MDTVNVWRVAILAWTWKWTKWTTTWAVWTPTGQYFRNVDKTFLVVGKLFIHTPNYMCCLLLFVTKHTHSILGNLGCTFQILPNIIWCIPLLLLGICVVNFIFTLSCGKILKFEIRWPATPQRRNSALAGQNLAFHLVDCDADCIPNFLCLKNLKRASRLTLLGDSTNPAQLNGDAHNHTVFWHPAITFVYVPFTAERNIRTLDFAKISPGYPRLAALGS